MQQGDSPCSSQMEIATNYLGDILIPSLEIVFFCIQGNETTNKKLKRQG
jgi:hypothetical protein